MSKRYLHHEITKELVAVAQAVTYAETVIQNGTLINVHTHELIPNIDIAITHGRIALVGDASHTIGPDTTVIDATGLYIAPGFMDGHIHVESSMLTVKNYAKAVIPHGTTSIFMDPHEIANVLGMDGITFMIEDGKDTPLNVYTTMPSCVPATPGFEDTGAILDANSIEKAMATPSIIGLGEMMNFPGVLNGSEEVHKALSATLANNKTITGHFSIPETKQLLNAYIASGARCCHESVSKEEALAKMRLGMYVQLREGSAWHDVKETIKALTETNVDTRFATLVSDDTHPDTLIQLGHMDHIVKRAIEEGVNPITAIEMATINVADCFGLSKDLGSIAPGKWADILLLSDLTSVNVQSVIINGELVAKDGKLCVPIADSVVDAKLKNTMHVKKRFTEDDFVISSPTSNDSSTLVHVMEAIEAKVGTHHLTHSLPVINGIVQNDLSNDIIKVCVIERHLATGTMGKGFVKGFHLQKGAVASTVAHDAHNLLVMGTNDADMTLAANTLVECGGGMVVVNNGKVLALNPLPIAGLMSEDAAKEVAKRVAAIDEAWKVLGCDLVSPFMTMALLSLAVLPEIRLTNRGLIDTTTFEFISLFANQA